MLKNYGNYGGKIIAELVPIDGTLKDKEKTSIIDLEIIPYGRF